MKKISNENTELKEDFFFINEFNQEKILSNILSLSKDRLKNYGEQRIKRKI